MGSDIHLYVEYDDAENGKPFAEIDSVHLFNEGELLIPRDYYLFSVLAGVRSYDEFTPKFPPRGLPKVSSVDIINIFHFHIIDDPSERLQEYDVTRDQALQWVARGCSYIKDSWTKKDGFVSDPEAHSTSWLTLGEIFASFEHSPYELSDMPKEFLVVIDLLKSLEKYFGVGKARIVFWFDN